MAVYKVTLLVKLNDESHPRKWMPETITSSLESGEDLLDYRFEEMDVETTELVDNLG